LVVKIIVVAIEALLPELAIQFQPVDNVLERTGFEPAGPPLRLLTAGDQTCALQPSIV
jgi:hypothetical protein